MSKPSDASMLRARELANKINSGKFSGLTEDLIAAEFEAVRDEALDEAIEVVDGIYGNVCGDFIRALRVIHQAERREHAYGFTFSARNTNEVLMTLFCDFHKMVFETLLQMEKEKK